MGRNCKTIERVKVSKIVEYIIEHRKTRKRQKWVERVKLERERE